MFTCWLNGIHIGIEESGNKRKNVKLITVTINKQILFRVRLPLKIISKLNDVISISPTYNIRWGT
jgi:hypothetical protein